MKRFYTLLILLLGLLNSLMAAVVVNDIYYDLDRTNKTAEVSGTNCVKEVVEIPGTIIVEGVSYKITSIGFYAFGECKELTSITIGRNVTKINVWAFLDCSNLESITIPNSLTTIDYYRLLDECSSLTKVNYLGTMEEWLKANIRIPTSFDLYLNGVLQTNVNISSIDSIRKDAFRNCKSIKSVEISGSVTSIGLDAFYDCSALTSITIPNSVTFIDAGAFTNCSSLTKVNYLGSVDEWLDINFTNSNNNPTVYAKDLYINGKLLTDVKISSADSIKDFAICFCKSIKSVEIGNSVAYIDKNAFSGCSGLTSVTWNIKNYPGFVRDYESPFYGFNITSFTFGNEVERVPAHICYGLKSLKEVTIGTNVISIGSYAFKYCFALTSVIWKAKNCQDFSSYIDGPFYPSDAKNITLVLGTEVEHIPLNLCNYDNFSKVNYLGSVNKWVDLDLNSQGSNPTYYTKDLYIKGELLTDVKISSADSIKKYAFYNCKSIKSLEIGKSVTYIGESAFSGCSGLVKVNYLGSVDKWAQINFASLYANPTNNTNDLYINDELLTEVRISSADNIKKYAFYNCKSLKNVEMSDTLTTVDEYAFYNCSDLTSVSIGKGVTIIGNNAFNNCGKLNTIVSYPTAVPTAYNNSFKNYNATLYVPCDAYDNYSSDDVFGQFKVINCITAEEEGGTTPIPTPTPNPEPEPTPGGEITLYYVNKTGWSAVNAYVWDNATGTPILAWSGEPATKLDKTVDGYEVYSYTFDSSLADRIIFNNGNGGEGNQTQDLTFEASKPYFYDGVWYETLTFDTNGGGIVDPNPTPDPEPEPDPTPDPNVAPLYVKGGFNNWEVNDTYKLTSADGNYYVANYSAGNEITISGNFKISNEDWSVNYGGGFLIEAGKSYTLTAGGANLDTAGKIKASKVEFTQSTGVLKITGTTSSNEFDTTKDQGVAFVVNPRGTSPVYVPLTYSYNAESQTAQYTGTYTVTELGVTAKIGGLTNFNVIDYGTNGQPVMPKFIYDMVKGAYDGFTIEGDYKVGDVLNILVLFDKDWNSSILINVQEAGTNPTPDPKPEPEPTPDGEITLYYVNKTGWSAVNAYVWDFATGAPIVAWSGEPATKLDKTVDGKEVYSYTFDSSLADRIIFNNGNGGVGNQTDDLTFEASKPYFYDGVWYETLTFDTNGGGTVDPNPTPDPEPDPAEPAFIVAGNGGSDATGIWCSGIEWNPSAEANKMKDADKDGIFEITYSNVPAGTWSFKVVAHDGGTFWLGGFFLDTENSSNGVTAVSDDGNINFTLNAPANVTVKFNTTISRIIITTPSGNFGKVTIDYFSVANTDECLVENRFTAANNNTLKYTENIQILEGNEYGYAVYRILGNCNYAVYEKNLYVEVTEAGIYDITIVFNGDYENPDFTVTAVKQGGTTDPDTPDDDINVSVEEVSAIMIYAKEGTVYSEVDFEIYDLAGVNVTKLNGSLQGVYIVKTAEGNRLISIW